jgi:hypothetical protein
MIDLSHWLTKPEAAARLGVSERTLDRMGSSGPARAERPRPGKKPEVVFNPDDVAALTAPKPDINPPAMPRLGAPANTAALALRGEGAMPPVVTAALTIIEKVAQTMSERRPAPATFQEIWLTAENAAAYSGLSKALLIRLARAGRLVAIKDPGWKFRRMDIDNADIRTLVAGLAGLPKAK